MFLRDFIFFYKYIYRAKYIDATIIIFTLENVLFLIKVQSISQINAFCSL